VRIPPSLVPDRTMCLNLRGVKQGEEYVERVQLIHEFLNRFELIRLFDQVLNRASQPFSTSLGTLDAIHLSSCILYRERLAKELVLCTHDISLKRAGLSLGLTVWG
jgi:hypothetical protein